VTIEVVDAAGAVVATYSSDPSRQPPPRGGPGGGRPGGIPNTSPLWRQAPEPMSAAAGMHRVAWTLTPAGGFGGGGGGGGGGRTEAPPIVGTFTVRLTVGSQTLTQPITVRPDPRR